MKIICFKDSIDSFFVKITFRRDQLYKVYFDVDNKIKKVKLVSNYFDNTLHALDNILCDFSYKIIDFNNLDRSIEYLSNNNIDRAYALLEAIKVWSEYEQSTIKETIHYKDAFLEDYIVKSDEKFAGDYFD